jgi:DNA-binding NarL/FixJ family response regulator
LKDCAREELFRAIRSAKEGEPVFAPSVARRLIGKMRSPAEEKLSSRELEVLQLVAAGASNAEIAGRLHISQATVKSHLIHIFGKLGVSDRTAAVTVALQRGLIRLEN